MPTRAAVYGLPQSDMHELGLIIEVVEHVERIATEQHFNAVSEVELHIGESFNIVPSLMRNVYKQASVGTVMENSSLIIQVIKASARCNRCKTVLTHYKPAVFASVAARVITPLSAEKNF